MIDPERIQRLAAKMGNRKDALEMVHQMRCGGKKYDGGGKFFRTSIQNESPMMYQPMKPWMPDVSVPMRFIPEPDLGDYVPPSSTGLAENYPITVSVPSVRPDIGFVAPEVVEDVVDLFSDEAKARRRLKQRYAESRFNNKAVSKAGAQGAWQIMPITLKDYLGRGRGKAGDLDDPEYNGKIRDWVMGIIPRDLQEFWSDDDSDINKLAKLYAAYNWGAGSLRNYLRKRQKAGKSIDDPYEWVEDLNPETRRYVKYLAFDEDIPDSTYTNTAFEDAARSRGYMAEGGRLFEDGGPEKTWQEVPLSYAPETQVFSPLQPLRDPVGNDKFVYTFGNWLNNRRDILAKNMADAGMDSGGRRYFALPLYNTLGLSQEEKAVNDELESQLARVEDAGYVEKLLPLFTHGQYNTKKNTVELSTVLGDSGNPKDVVALHEYGHALGQGSPQEEVIRRHFSGRPVRDKYLDDPSEIYTRLMTFRKLHNIDPNKVYTLDDIKELRGEAKKDFDEVITKPWTEHDKLQAEYAKKLADFLYPKLRDKVKDKWWWKRNGGGEGFYRSLKSDFIYARDLANQFGVEIPSEIQEIFDRSIKVINNDNSLQGVRYSEDNDFFKRMSDEDMLFLLNEVADSGDQESLYDNHLGNISANGGNLFRTGGPGSITGVSPVNMLVPFVDKTIEKITEGDTAKKIANWYHNHADKIPPRLHRTIYNTIKESAFGNDALSELKYNFIPNLLEDIKYSEYGGMGSADNVFLMSPEQQKSQLESLGWKQVDTSGGYGLVNSAVQKYKSATGRDVPMYQVGDDEVSREQLIPVGDFTYHPILNYTWVIDEQDPETGFVYSQHTEDKLKSRGDTAHAPGRYYRDMDGNLYFKEWDFFDHGDYSRGNYSDDIRGGYVTRSLTDMSERYGNILDMAGNPFVKTTGYTKLTDDAQVIDNALREIIGYDSYDNEYGGNAESALDAIKSGKYDVKASGGKIHIKPENRGKFTALLKRTGKSASWFKEHGTPAQKKMAVFALNSRKWKHGDGGPLDNYFYDGGPYGVIPLGSDYLTYLQTMPEVSGGSIDPAVVTAALPEKFNGSQAAAARYAEGYQKGAKPVSEAMNRAGQKIFNTVDTVVGLTPTPAGAITWLGHMGADAAEGEWGKVGRDAALALALGAGARGVGWLKNYVDDATNFGEDVFRAFTDRAPGRVSTNFTYAAPATRAAVEAVPAVANAVSAPHEIADLGGGYMLKSLMRGNPLEKQISKNGTVNVNNVRALVGKGSKVEQAVVDKVLASEEFAGKKSIDYNKFRKAVQDELITYERTPDTRWEDYGISRLGYNPDTGVIGFQEGFAKAFVKENPRYRISPVGEIHNGEEYYYIIDENGNTLSASQINRIMPELDFESYYIPREDSYTEHTFTFSSPRIPSGSSKHYDPNTLGHSRTYTTADEPDVLHVMESQSDWAQEGLKPQNRFFNSKGEDITDIVKRSWTAERKTPVERMYDYDSRIYVFGDTPEERAEFDKLTEEYNKLNERIQASSDFNPDDFYKQRELKEKLDKIATVPYEGTGRSRGRLGVSRKTPHLRTGLEERIVSPGTQETYLANNYTSRQIQENLRYAAEKGQTKMRYPTRETAAKIEGYTKGEAYFDEAGNDITNTGENLYTIGDENEKRLSDVKSKLKDYSDRFKIYLSPDGRFSWGSELTDPAITQLEEAIPRRKAAYEGWKASHPNSSSQAALKKIEAMEQTLQKHLDTRKEIKSLIAERDRLQKIKPTLKPGITRKEIYTAAGDKETAETILHKYDAFPKQFKKLYKNADVRTVTDPKGNTWYEVDVPENYLQQEWAYEDGGSMILPKMMMDKHSPDKLRKAIASIKAKRMQ